jgi:hypothetical protein
MERIHARHERDDNDHRHLLSEDPLEVLTYLQRLGQRGLVGDTTSHDVKDGLIVRLWLWWRGEQAEAWLLEQAEGLELNRRDVGGVLGVRTGQGLVDRLRIKRRMLDAARPGRQTKPDVSVQSLREAQQRWVTHHRREIQEIAEALVGHWGLVEGDEESEDWLEEVQRDLSDQAYTVGSANLIQLAVDAMSAVAEVREQQDDHPLQRAITTWHSLRRSYPEG